MNEIVPVKEFAECELLCPTGKVRIPVLYSRHEAIAVLRRCGLPIEDHHPSSIRLALEAVGAKHLIMHDDNYSMERVYEWK